MYTPCCAEHKHAHTTYDTASRPLSLVRPDGARTDWTWRPGDLLLEVRHGFAGGAGVSFTYQHNREGALAWRRVSDAAWQAHPDDNTDPD